MSTPTHLCAARPCAARISTKYLMCFTHWRMVPRHQQTEVYAAYHSGTRKNTHPTDQYVAAVAAARESVTQQQAKSNA